MVLNGSGSYPWLGFVVIPMLAKRWNMFWCVFVFHGSSDNIQNPTINLHIIFEYGRSYYCKKGEA